MADQLPLFFIPSPFDPITPHHLLTHTSGLASGTDHVPSQEYELWLMRHTSLSVAPNERFMYSNLGYKALGMLIEHVTGRSYADVVTERIFAPLGITNSEASITHETRTRLAPGYTPRFDDRPFLQRYGWVPATWLETNTADGCLAMTAPDLAAWLRCLLNRGVTDSGARILTDEQFGLLLRPHQAETPSPDYGYGIVSEQTDDGRQVIGHGGGMVGWVSMMTGDLDAGIGVVVFNNAYGNPDRLAEFALRVVVAGKAGAPLPDLPAPPDPLAIVDAADYCGTWQGPEGSLEITTHGDGLAVRRDGNLLPLIAGDPGVKGDLFMIDHPAFDRHYLRFHRDDDGALTELTHGSNWYAKPGDPVPAEEPPVPDAWRALVGHYRNYNPWQGNVHIYVRKGQLWLGMRGSRFEVPLQPDGDGFTYDTPRSARERITFGPVYNGKALAVRTDSGVEMSRFFTP